VRGLGQFYVVEISIYPSISCDSSEAYFEYTSTTFAGSSTASSGIPPPWMTGSPVCAASWAAIFSSIRSARFVPCPSSVSSLVIDCVRGFAVVEGMNLLKRAMSFGSISYTTVWSVHFASNGCPRTHHFFNNIPLLITPHLIVIMPRITLI